MVRKKGHTRERGTKQVQAGMMGREGNRYSRVAGRGRWTEDTEAQCSRRAAGEGYSQRKLGAVAGQRRRKWQVASGEPQGAQQAHQPFPPSISSSRLTVQPPPRG